MPVWSSSRLLFSSLFSICTCCVGSLLMHTFLLYFRSFDKDISKVRLSKLLASLISIGLHLFFSYKPSQWQSLIRVLMFRKLIIAFTLIWLTHPFFFGPRFCSLLFLGPLHHCLQLFACMGPLYFRLEVLLSSRCYR